LEGVPSAGPALDRRFALAAAVGVPALAGLVLGVTLLAGPFAAWVTGLLAYWAFLGGALLAWGDRDWLREWLEARWPGWLAATLLVLPALALGAMTLRLLGQDPLPPHLVIATAMGAALNAVLEELFWRGALIPESTPRSAALSLALFTGAHVIWLAALGLETGGPAWAAPASALVLGGVWTASRLLTGTVGAAVLSHAGVNLFAFLQVVALNA
jgi:membrane protease YdiL (CAAX protease family)